MSEPTPQVSTANVLIRIAVCAAVLAVGAIGMLSLASMRKPPAEATPEERSLRVETQRAVYEDVTVYISGFGEARALNTVTIAPEVAGRLVGVHARLEVGEVIGAGEVLFEIDPTNYQAARDEARATVAQLKSAVARLEKQFALDRDRLATLDRSRDLARDEFTRLEELYRKHDVGTRSAVDAAERAANAVADQADQMAQAVALYPLQIQETRSRLTAARAGLTLAAANLARCRVTASFDGRVQAVSIEAGQYVVPGQAALTLADDRVLEIKVPLDSRDARRWLKFDDQAARRTAWFNGLVAERVRIAWTEDRTGHAWFGRLHRVVAFDPATRTLTVAVRIAAADAVNGGALPLVDGMFCRVAIPGRVLTDVVRVPRWAVGMNDTVYVARDNRLKTVPVTVTRVEGDQAFISEGLQPGDRVITTRLVDPLENTLLEITPPGQESASS